MESKPPILRAASGLPTTYGHLIERKVEVTQIVINSIEIRDPITGEMTNLILQVQSKATDQDFLADTPTGFDYYCEQRDLHYWLSGNGPVILVRSRPATKEAY